MINNREVCLFITLRCNQNCRYCHRFLNIDEVGFEENKKIIDRLVEDGIKNLTFTGGEPLLYPNVLELVKYAKVNKKYMEVPKFPAVERDMAIIVDESIEVGEIEKIVTKKSKKKRE